MAASTLKRWAGYLGMVVGLYVLVTLVVLLLPILAPFLSGPRGWIAAAVVGTLAGALVFLRQGPIASSVGRVNVLPAGDSPAVSSPLLLAQTQRGGGVTFILKAVIGIMILMVLVRIGFWAAAFGLEVLQNPRVIRWSIVASGSLVLAVLMFAFLPRSLANHSWKKLAKPWQAFQGVSTVSVLGLALAPLGIPDLTAGMADLGLGVVSGMYVGAVASLGLSFLISLVGVAATADMEGKQPVGAFVPAFAFAWVGALLSFTVFFTCVLALAHLRLIGYAPA